MKDTTRENTPERRNRPARDGPELRVVGVDVNPAPDAEERLRRLFTILARLVEDEPPAPGIDPSADDGGEESEA